MNDKGSCLKEYSPDARRGARTYSILARVSDTCSRSVAFENVSIHRKVKMNYWWWLMPVIQTQAIAYILPSRRGYYWMASYVSPDSRVRYP
jgi:hypothetical protein